MPSQGPAPSGRDGAVEGLDALVDRLAAEQRESLAAQRAQELTGSDGAQSPGSELLAGERETLESFLEFLRATVLWKVDGLSDQQASRHLVGSGTTVIGMLRHLADTERYWFREILGGVPTREVGYRRSDGRDPAGQWRLEPGASLAEAADDYRAAAEQSRAQLAGREPDEEVHGGGEMRTVRWIQTHMIEETARHAGHLDILAELLDGRTGE